MKRIHLAETGILIIILISFYQFLTALMELITTLFFQVSNSMPGVNNSIILSLAFNFVLYLSVIYLLISYKKQLAKLLSGKEKDETMLPMNFTGRQLLQTTIVVLCIVTLINELPVAVSILIETFRTEPTYNDNGNYFYDPIMSASFLSPIIKTLFAILILFLSKKISNLMSTKAD